MTALLTSCGSGVAGTYKIKSVKESGQEMDRDQLKALAQLAGMDLDDMFSLKLTNDGKAIFIMSGETTEGTYKVNGSTISISFGGSTADAELKGNTLTISAGSTELVFQK